jgi:hypothetical protein
MTLESQAETLIIDRVLRDDPKVSSPEIGTSRSARGLKITREANSLANSLVLDNRDHHASF